VMHMVVFLIFGIFRQNSEIRNVVVEDWVSLSGLVMKVG